MQAQSALFFPLRIQRHTFRKFAYPGAVGFRAPPKYRIIASRMLIRAVKFGVSPRARRRSFVMISANAAMPGSYDHLQVALSVLIAIAASYAALDLAGRVTAASGWSRSAWLTGGAAAMGIGIWSMHFTGMLAYNLPVPAGYHLPTEFLSLLAAILASAVALFVATRKKMGLVQALTGRSAPRAPSGGGYHEPNRS